MLSRLASFRRHASANLLRPAYFFLFGTCSIVLIRDNIASLDPITGSSMSPALSPDYHETRARDVVLFTSWQPTVGLKRGDIVSFRKPHDPEGISVKRIVGMPGDIVLVRGEGERGPGGLTGRGRDPWPWRRMVVPYGHLWLEGDNWRQSLDSNDFGPVPSGLVIGKAIAVLWPWNRQGKVSDNTDPKRTKIIPREEIPTLPVEWI